MAPPILAYRVHSLPPILHMQAQNPMSSWCTGAQGRSGFLRVQGLRYLRTVIVTAAVYWGFNSELCLR